MRPALHPAARLAGHPDGHPDGLPAVLSDLAEQNALYRRMIAICDRVGDAALRGADPRELTRVFARLVDADVVLLDPSLCVLAQAGGDGEDSHPWNPWDEGTWCCGRSAPN